MSNVSATLNGNVVEVYDYQAAWSTFYRLDRASGRIAYMSGAVDAREYRTAVRALLMTFVTRG